MGNQEHQEQSTDLESEILSEEPPSFEEQPDLLNKVFDDNIDRIDDDTIYFIIYTLNQLNIDQIRNKILLQVLPLKV